MKVIMTAASKQKRMGLGMLVQTFCRWIQLGNLMLRFYPGEKD